MDPFRPPFVPPFVPPLMPPLYPDEREAETARSHDEAREDEAPFVCAGCHAVGGERCAPGCIDAEIEAEHREAIESGNYERFDDEEGSF
jgi:hypothetical protein